VQNGDAQAENARLANAAVKRMRTTPSSDWSDDYGRYE